MSEKEEKTEEKVEARTLEGTVGDTRFEKAMSENYLIYAWSTLLDRALPQIDGLLPVQRRIILTMDKENLAAGSKYKKCASIVGTCLAVYHPHGDASVYGALARMSQNFSMRVPLVDGQGSFGSIDGDPPAAYRYTEARMTEAAEEMVADLDKEILPDYMGRNFDESLLEAAILPTRFPNLLINGAYGIATGMTSFFLPHNPGEAMNLCTWRLENPKASIEEAVKQISGPDFPTGGVVVDDENLEQMYLTGKGRITGVAKAHIEKGEKGKSKIIITELPWMVQKGGDNGVLKKLSVQYSEGKYPEFDSLNDYSTEEIRIEIGLKRGANPNAVLERVLNNTGLKKTYGVEMNCVVGGRPKTINLLELIDLFLEFRRYVVIKRAEKRINEIKRRLHRLEAYMKVISATDKVVQIIKKSKDRASAKPPLKKLLKIDDDQAQLIVEMQLGSLTQLDSFKIEEEIKELNKELAELEKFIKTPKLVTKGMIDEFNQLKTTWEKEGIAKRKTSLVKASSVSVDSAGLAEENLNQGPSKEARLLISSDGRAGLALIDGKKSGSLKLKDSERLVTALDVSTNDEVIIFTSAGNAYRLRLNELEGTTRKMAGEKLTALTGASKDEFVVGAVPVVRGVDDNKVPLYPEVDEKSDIFLTTKEGVVKRVALNDVLSASGAGLVVIKLGGGDELKSANINDSEKNEILILTTAAKALRFPVDKVRVMGRGAGGVKGITMKDGSVASVKIIRGEKEVIIEHQSGQAKRFDLEGISAKGRGGQGVTVSKIDAKYGPTELIVLVNGETVLVEEKPGELKEVELAEITSGKVNTTAKAFRDSFKSIF
jgi:DNA gyrase subunit A